LPTSSSESARALIERVGEAVGASARVSAIPQWVWPVAGIFSPVRGATAEMTYQWKVPYVIDDRRFRSTLGVRPHADRKAVREVAEAARAKYAHAA
jgi:hypothetical protein